MSALGYVSPLVLVLDLSIFFLVIEKIRPTKIDMASAIETVMIRLMKKILSRHPKCDISKSHDNNDDVIVEPMIANQSLRKNECQMTAVKSEMM